MCSFTVARGVSRGMLPRKISEKNGVFWCNLGRPKVCYYQPKNQEFKGEKINKKHNCHISLSDSLDEHASTKIDRFGNYTGTWGLVPQKQKICFIKSNQKEAFPY